MSEMFFYISELIHQRRVARRCSRHANEGSIDHAESAAARLRWLSYLWMAASESRGYAGAEVSPVAFFSSHQ